ncbi:MAG TPA: hypothetical protein VFG35_25085 [Actinoplanes sp.]|nr:hypothetical protein [Actinoplanes sp.]
MSAETLPGTSPVVATRRTLYRYLNTLVEHQELPVPVVTVFGDATRSLWLRFETPHNRDAWASKLDLTPTVEAPTILSGTLLGWTVTAVVGS